MSRTEVSRGSRGPAGAIDGGHEAPFRVAGVVSSRWQPGLSGADLENIVNEVEQKLHESANKEVAVSHIGEFVMLELQGLDQVAYVRFASVYRDFKDAHEFVETIRGLLDPRDK